MLVNAVIIMGAIVILQLWRVIELLKASRTILQNLSDLKEEIRDVRRSMEHEVRAAFDDRNASSFAHDLGKKLEELQQSIHSEFKWYEKATFAHELREWLQEISNSVTAEIQSGTNEIVGSLSEIGRKASGK